MNIVKEAKYIMTNVGNNNNKFWYIFIYDNNLVRTENGRVGNGGDSHEFPKDSLADAEKFFASKCREKEKKGYKKLDVVTSGSPKTSASTVSVKIDHNLSDLAKKQIEHTSPIVTKLIERLTLSNVHNILDNTTMSYNTDTGLFTTPCGIVGKDTIDKARIILGDMSKFILERDFRNSNYIGNLEEYLMLIPQKVGRKLDPETLFSSKVDVLKQNDILDSLEASLLSITNTAIVPVTESVNAPRLFSVKLDKVEDEKIISSISKRFRDTLNRSHSCSHLKVKSVYSVEIGSMLEEFNKYGIKYGNVKQLWHGTRVSNLLSILKSGLQIMPSGSANITGRMFGATKNEGDIKRNCGLYFSDQSTKSLNYSFGYWDSKGKDSNCFMFSCSVALGKAYTPRSPSESFPAAGYDSTFAKGGYSGVSNNEYIIYRKSQCNLDYLVEFC